MMDMGAQFSSDGTVETFGNDEIALKAVEDSTVVVDLSHFGRIRVIGDDRIHFMHNQSTADFQSLADGQGCDTVFLTPTARTVDLANAWVMVMKFLNLGEIVGKPYGTHLHYTVEGNPVTVGVGSVLSETGFSLLLSPTIAGLIWKSIVKFGAIPMGACAWERLRIIKGRPAAGKELTSEFNVLEAGLWKAISLTKGCYIGQETIARLITYDGVKQHLWGIQLDGPAAVGSNITVNGTKVGKLTSYALGSNGIKHAGLGYVKRQFSVPGQEVNIGDIRGVLVDVSFISRSLPVTMQMAGK